MWAGLPAGAGREHSWLLGGTWMKPRSPPICLPTRSLIIGVPKDTFSIMIYLLQ